MKMMILQEMAPQKPQYSYRNTMVSRTGGEKDKIFMETWKSVCRWFFLSEWFTVCTFSRFCADLAPPGPTPESFINATFSWCFWGAFHWKSGNSLKSWILHIFMEFYGFPWNSMKFTKERDSHPSCHFSRRCEGSRNHSIPIGLLMFSRRGREGSALFQEFMIFCIF